MKVWCVPVNFPDPEEQPEQAEAATKFLKMLPGLWGICPHENGLALLTFQGRENARVAKWKLEEFSQIGLEIIEGTVSKDGKTLNLCKVVKE